MGGRRAFIIDTRIARGMVHELCRAESRVFPNVSRCFHGEGVGSFSRPRAFFQSAIDPMANATRRHM
jgi:hypothetical protein